MPIPRLRDFALSVLLLSAGLPPLHGQENVAAGKPVTASGTLWPGFPPAYLTDENTATFTHPNLSTGTNGFHFVIDFEREVALERVVVTGRGDGCCPERLRRYRVELLADDGGSPGDANWTADVRMNNAVMPVGGSDTLRADDGEGTFAGRYLRLSNISGQGYNPQVAEVQAWSVPGPEIRLFAPDAGNISAGGNPSLPAAATLTWIVENADSIALDPPAGPIAGATGSVSVFPSQRTAYTLTATKGSAVASATVTIGVDDPVAALQITEISAAGGGALEDRDGESSDWIQIYNPNSYTYNPAGARLSDDPAFPAKWTFPQAAIAPGGYLVVFASGKDVAEAGSEMHTSFSLAQEGEFLALFAPDGATIWSSLGPAYPSQRAGTTYGIDSSGAWRFFTPGSPGAANPDDGAAGIVADPVFSVTRGYYDSPQTVAISSATPGAVIRYTRNGQPPGPSTGSVYSSPIAVNETTVLRAIAVRDDYLDSRIETHTYLFVDDIIAGSNMRKSVTEHAEYSPQMRDALRDVPGVSVVAARVSAINGDAEVPASVEFLDPAVTTGGAPAGIVVPQANAGVRYFGGAYTDFAKKNFRLYFRGIYGDTKLDGALFPDRGDGWQPAESFDALELRGGSHDMAMRGFYLSNLFCDDTLAEMGHVQPHGRMVHLFLNGSYHGLYHLRERWGASMVSNYLGGSKRDYESINGNLNVGGWSPGSVYDGDGSAWARANDMRSEYPEIGKYVNIDQYLDYMIVWMFGNAEDEYRATGPWREDGGSGFLFMLNDADGWLSINEQNQVAAWDGNQNNTVRAGSVPGRAAGDGPASLLSAWLRSGGDEFRIRLADRIRLALGPGGALTRERNRARLTEMAAAFERPFLAEAARWNYRSPASWATARDRCLTNWMQTRTQAVLSQFRSAGLYPSVAAPEFSADGGPVPAGGAVAVTAAGAGPPAIFLTTDGSDPRLPGGAANPAAQEVASGAGVPVTGGMRLRARARSGAGVWSAATEAFYYPEGTSPLPPGSVIVSELHYFPAAGGEFLELLNVSAQTVNLRGATFGSGIRFGFSRWHDTLLEPGGRLVLADNDFAFRSIHGWDAEVAGVYRGNLSNDGERLALVNADGMTVFDFRWDANWAPESAGGGVSLVVALPGTGLDLSRRETWTAGSVPGGTPNAGEGGSFPGTDPDGDDNGDGFPNFAHYALAAAGPLRLPEIESSADGPRLIVWRNAAADDARVTIEASAAPDTGWAPLEDATLIGSTAAGAIVRETWRIPAGDPVRFLRLKIVRIGSDSLRQIR